MTDDLVAWLRAQLDWQEEIAHKWQAKDEEADRLFVGHVSPSWTLREVEAKRRILSLHSTQRLRHRQRWPNRPARYAEQAGRGVTIDSNVRLTPSKKLPNQPAMPPKLPPP